MFIIDQWPCYILPLKENTNLVNPQFTETESAVEPFGADVFFWASSAFLLLYSLKEALIR